MPTIARAGRCLAAGSVSCALLLAPAVAIAQNGSKSMAAAKQLTEVLDRLKLDAIAAPDPADAALSWPRSISRAASCWSSRPAYSAPTLLTAKLAKKDYRDVYIDLNAASVAGSKIFVMDQTCDGLVAKPGDNAPGTGRGRKPRCSTGTGRRPRSRRTSTRRPLRGRTKVLAHPDAARRPGPKERVVVRSGFRVSRWTWR